MVSAVLKSVLFSLQPPPSPSPDLSRIYCSAQLGSAAHEEACSFFSGVPIHGHIGTVGLPRGQLSERHRGMGRHLLVTLLRRETRPWS